MANSPKTRDYFITINQNAECYGQALDIVKELNYNLYAYILHDKDIIVNENGQAQLKEQHKHIVIELKNPVSFDSMRNKFKGAHIEMIKYKKTAYQYLLHESPNSHEKYNYDISEIVSNNIESVRVAIEQETTLELFKEARFLDYIIDGITTPYAFTKRFGLNAYKQYWNSYYDMIKLSNTDPEMINDIEAIRAEREAELERQGKGEIW